MNTIDDLYATKVKPEELLYLVKKMTRLGSGGNIPYKGRIYVVGSVEQADPVATIADWARRGDRHFSPTSLASQ
jgi:hypothetical protein